MMQISQASNTPITRYYGTLPPSTANKSSLGSPNQDKVSLSQEGKKLQENSALSIASLMENFMDGAGKDGKITLDEMKACAEKKYKVADGAFQQVLSDLGITDSASIKVNIDKKGQINVTSNLSKQDNDRLQTALNDSQTFSQAFRAAVSTKETIAATERHLEFATAYAQNPKTAVARYGIGSKSPAGQAFFRYSEGASSLEYETLLSMF